MRDTVRWIGAWVLVWVLLAVFLWWIASSFYYKSPVVTVSVILLFDFIIGFVFVAVPELVVYLLTWPGGKE